MSSCLCAALFGGPVVREFEAGLRALKESTKASAESCAQARFKTKAQMRAAGGKEEVVSRAHRLMEELLTESIATFDLAALELGEEARHGELSTSRSGSLSRRKADAAHPHRLPSVPPLCTSWPRTCPAARWVCRHQRVLVHDERRLPRAEPLLRLDLRHAEPARRHCGGHRQTGCSARELRAGGPALLAAARRPLPGRRVPLGLVRCSMRRVSDADRPLRNVTFSVR